MAGRRPGEGWPLSALPWLGCLCSYNSPTPVVLFGLARRVKLLLLVLSFLYPSLWNLLDLLITYKSKENK